MPTKKFAIYAITKHGIAIGKDLLQKLEYAELFSLEKFAPQLPSSAVILPQPFSKELAKYWSDYECHIFIVSVGAVVRMIAPLLKSKKVDPAVICIDDRGKYSIALLSGHVGKANEFTVDIAHKLNNEAIITTASDVQGTLTVDILGRELGWVLHDHEHNITPGCAAVVNEEPVAIHQETGESNFWPAGKAWPPGVSYFPGPLRLSHLSPVMNLIISDRNLEKSHPDVYKKSIVYHPKSLVVGIGCDSQTPEPALMRAMKMIFAEYQLSTKSIALLASIDIKAQELGLQTFASSLQVPLQAFTANELDNTAGVANPSAVVKKYVGTNSVAEAAALLGSGTEQLLVEKHKIYDPDAQKNITIAICRKNFTPRTSL